MAALLQEIVAVYPLLYPPALTAHASNRVCNALALLQCVASHSETRQLFLTGSRLVLLCYHNFNMIPQPTSPYFFIHFSTPHPKRGLLNTLG